MMSLCSSLDNSSVKIFSRSLGSEIFAISVLSHLTSSSRLVIVSSSFVVRACFWADNMYSSRASAVHAANFIAVCFSAKGRNSVVVSGD